MSRANRIFRLGNSAQGGKLRARFVGDIPTAVQVKGTNDRQNVKIRTGPNGQQIGKWVSKNKYQSRLVTLQLIRNDNVYKECKYDACGMLIPERPDAAVTNVSISQSNGTVTFSWKSTIEIALDLYVLERKLPGHTNFEPFEGEEPLGIGTTYTEVDTPGVSGVITYRLKAIFLDGSEKILSEQTINVTTTSSNSATLEQFELSNSSGIVTITFKTATEVNVAKLFIDRRIDGEPDFSMLKEFTPTGAGSTYLFDDFPNAIGVVCYRIRARFIDNVEIVFQPQCIDVF
ncbi:MAG: hypothetical protein NZ529_01080 [Cytophagaceae bacterium]|nr:hypothetical protein [Cytophagaceae bacterium]MDW8455358.1 hypothetical protein [Cytophagaceae bacterium]